MNAAELQALDKAVWQCLGYGDRWFPVTVPLKGPDWEVDVMAHNGNPNPTKLKLDSYPPVTQDWNVAFWALDRCRELPDASGLIRPSAGLFSGLIHDGKWSVSIGGYWYNGCADGPVTMCKAILRHRGCEYNA